MTTDEMVKELREWASQCIDAPKSKAILTEMADRLEELQRWNDNAREEPLERDTLT